MEPLEGRVKEDTVSKQREHDEVNRGPHAGLDSPLRANTVVHHLVPVLPRQDLRKHSTVTSMFLECSQGHLLSLSSIPRPERRSWWRQERCQSLSACSPQRWTWKKHVTRTVLQNKAQSRIYFYFLERNQSSPPPRLAGRWIIYSCDLYSRSHACHISQPLLSSTRGKTKRQ